jgi:hypothetical protein
MTSQFAVGGMPLARIEADVNALKADVVVLKTDVTQLKTDVAALKLDVGQLKIDVGELSTQLQVGLAEVRSQIHQSQAASTKNMLWFFVPLWLGVWANVFALVLQR